MRALLIAAGLLALAIGLVGVFVPLLPTTPFLLLAAGCFARASTRLHALLLRLPLAGRVLSEYEQAGGVTPGTRRAALLSMWLVLATSALLLAHRPWLLLVLAGSGALASAIILRLPAARPR